jgi:hypothetical protein
MIGVIPSDNLTSDPPVPRIKVFKQCDLDWLSARERGQGFVLGARSVGDLRT